MKKISTILIAFAFLGFDANAQIINTIAGDDSIGGYNGDNILATVAKLFGPNSVSLDTSGNVFISDQQNGRIRKVNVTTGIITTVAGGGTGLGDGGPATSVGIAPWGTKVDVHGNLFIADIGHNRIRKVDAITGIITTVAGNGNTGFNGDGILAINASIDLPEGVTVDSSGNIYLTDHNNGRIRKVDIITGLISTIAGGGTNSPVDGDTATSVNLSQVWGIALDNSGNIYFSWGLQVFKIVHSTNIITLVAGGGTNGLGDGGSAIDAALYGPEGIAVDDSGNVFIGDSGNRLIRKVNHSNGIINSVAGGGTNGLGDGGPATSAELDYPSGVTIDGHGNIYIADRFHNRIRKVSNYNTGITFIPTQNNSISIFPNPATNLLTLTLPNKNIKSCTINLYDMMGQLRMENGELRIENTQQFSTFNSQLSINLINLPQGIYFLEVNMDGEKVVLKVVKL